MSRAIRTCLILAVLLLQTAGAVSAASARRAEGNLRFTISVHEFENESGYQGSYELGHTWATHLTAALHENGNFIVIGERDMRGAAMDEQRFAATGATAQGDKAPERGQLTPAQLLVKGVITHFKVDSAGQDGTIGVAGFRVGAARARTEIHATIYLVDTSTGQVLASRNFTGEAKKRSLKLGFNRDGARGSINSGEDLKVVSAVEGAVEDVIPWLVDQLPSVLWRGSVVMVQGDRVYVNRGHREGVVEGETFVVGESQVIRDPDTGEVLDEAVTEVARLRAERVKEKLTICTVVDGDPTVIYKGMGIQRPAGV
ncbi:MAG: CsgG/HfaB family protein [Acidobacteriota bacterium]|jgi:curli biogenesis system outer membrane secretion channel CsgG